MRQIRVQLVLPLLLVLGGISAVVAPTAAEAVDLTGTWEGTAYCKGYFAGDKTTDKFEGPMTITQSGPDLNIEFLGFLYNGAIQTDNASPAKKGQGSFVLCSTVSDYSAISEIGAFTATLNLIRDAASSFKATSVYTTAPDNFQTCKWTFKRTGTTDPNVPACP